MRLSELLAAIPKPIKISAGTSDTEVTRVTSDSRQVTAGAIYVAVQGGTVDGHDFVEEAVEKGAALVLGEREAKSYSKDLPYLRVSDSRLVLGWLCAAFESHPSREMIMVGVTGTSGKTTTTYLIEAILRAAGKKVGVIGTVNFRFEGKVLPSTHTTPGAPELQRLFREMRSRGCEAVVMEVSSHALAQRRTAGTAYDAMVFCNLSSEHLDFHKDLEDYFQAKKLLFTEAVWDARAGGKRPAALINGDDDWGKRLLTEVKSGSAGFDEVRGFGASEDATVSGKLLRIGLDGVHGRVSGVEIHSTLIGAFNRENILAAVSTALALNISPEFITAGLSGVASVDGRMEKVENEAGIHVLVDYAHKPDALRKVLETLRTMGEESGWSGRLITVMGCGGDRDRSKRPVMGAIAAEGSDSVWVTSDNPRSEDPMAIIGEITGGMPGDTGWQVEPDRRKAIHAAIREALPGDLVLIAGKGHETYQIVKDPTSDRLLKIDFDDRQVAREALGNRR